MVCKMDEEDYSAVGFMFDSEHARLTKTLSLPGIDGDVVLAMIGEDPGHVQSGQYLWPAAQAAALHLINHWHLLRSLASEESDHSISVLELG